MSTFYCQPRIKDSVAICIIQKKSMCAVFGHQCEFPWSSHLPISPSLSPYPPPLPSPPPTNQLLLSFPLASIINHPFIYYTSHQHIDVYILIKSRSSPLPHSARGGGRHTFRGFLLPPPPRPHSVPSAHPFHPRTEYGANYHRVLLGRRHGLHNYTWMEAK